MFKKISTFMLILMLTFSPVASISANTQEADDIDATEEVNESEEQVNGEETSSETEEGEEVDSNEADESETVESDLDTPVADEPEEDNESAVEEETTEEDLNEGNENSEVNEEDETVGEDETAEDEEEEEELNLTDVFGTAKGEIAYDFNKGYYVLDLRAGITNFHTRQEIKNKWVAFTLPNGVQIADNLPSGVVPIGIAGKAGLAVKIPDVKSSSSEHVNKQIPLTGVENDNDPHLNTYLLDVDVNASTYEEIGQLRGQREIDFTVMEENPTLDLHGSITGKTTYDEDKKYHFLDVTVQALNQTNDSVNDLYVAFELPEGVEVVQDENTPANMEMLRLDGARAVALKLPNLEQGKEGELTYKIPVVGVSDAVVTSETISVFKILDAGYNQVGQFDGHIHVDFSDMDIAWHFDAIAQIIPDYPGVQGNQVGFNFKYEVKNIDVAEVEKVKIEFNVPNDITIEKPEYNGGSSVEVDWNGNNATVTLGDLGGASGYQGYFTAVGSTNKSIDQLKGMEVKVTLYRDGDTVVETLYVPFEVGKYADIGLDPVDDDDNGDSGNGGDDDGTPGTGGDGSKDSDTNKDGADKDKSGDGVKVTVEDGDDSSNGDGVAKTTDKKDGTGLSLPKTATNMYTILLIGALTLIAGASIMIFRKRNAME